MEKEKSFHVISRLNHIHQNSPTNIIEKILQTEEKYRAQRLQKENR